MRRLLSFLRPHAVLTVGLMILNLAMAALGVAAPLVIKQVVDGVIAGGEVALLPGYLIGLLGVAALRGAAGWAFTWGRELLGMRVITDIRSALYKKLLGLHWGFYDGERTGGLMSRMIGDVESTRVFLGSIVIDSVNHLTTIVLLLLAFTQQDLQLGVVALVPCLLSAGGLYVLFQRRRDLHMRMHESNAQYGAVLQDSLAGVRVVKSFAQEDQELHKFEKRIADIRSLHLEANWTWNTRFPFINSLNRTMQIALIGYGGWRVMDGDITLGTLVAAITFGGLLMAPFNALGQQMTSLGQTAAAAFRIFRLMDEPVAVKSPERPVPLPAMQGEITLREVSFRYAGARAHALENINLHVPAGSSIALVGGTGSGKSTLANLIGRFYDPTRGSVHVDGIDVRLVSTDVLRRQIGVVAQESLLFSDTLARNIAFGRVDAPREAIERAGALAQADEFIRELPDGYDTEIGERGVGLSGGQKQRVAIARAVVLDPRILILDDSLSAVDAETERALQSAIGSVMKGRTTVLVAHRLSTVMHADQIVVLDAGRIVESGTHAELAERSGYYREVRKMQSATKEAR